MSTLILPAVISGLMMGAVYALVALGLTLIYGVLHIINFAHGSLLMLALYAVYFLNTYLGIDPYLAIPIVLPVFFALGYALQRGLIGPMSSGSEQNVLLITLAVSIIIENLALYFWTSNTRNIDIPYVYDTVELFGAFIPSAVSSPSLERWPWCRCSGCSWPRRAPDRPFVPSPSRSAGLNWWG